MIHELGRFVTRLDQDTSGKLSVEMILLLALISLPIIILLVAFRQKIIIWFRTQFGQLDDPGQGAAP